MREHTETIYASADAPRTNGEVDTGKAWRTIRRPSDMVGTESCRMCRISRADGLSQNEHAKQLRELREQQRSGKVHGKVFVKGACSDMSIHYQ